VGGFVGGLVPGAIGGYLGGKLAAQYLPTETFNTSLQVPAGASETLHTAFQVLQSVGRISTDAADDTPLPRLSAVLGSGALGMNPTINVIIVSPVSDSESSVVIAGAAKEGLIKQHSAEKAVKRVKEMFVKDYPQATTGTGAV
jgi:hypothetical protein